ncbi:MAG: FecR family protein [Polyangiales bacterium]
MNRDCLEVEPLLGRADDLLAGDQRALRARHLAACTSCRAEERTLREVVSVMQRPHPALSEAARDRAFAAAFESATRAPASKAVTRPTRAFVYALAAAAIALVAVLRFTSGDAPALPAPVAQREVAAEPTTPLARAPEAPAQTAAVEPTDDIWIEVRTAQTRHFAHAEVALRAGTRVRFDAEARTLELASGEARVEVDPRPQASFAVVTQHMRVEVLGTVFTVAPTRVSVQRGRVRVLDPQGAVLAARLDAGERYALEDRPRAHALREKAEARPETLLRDARAALGRGDVTSARGLLARFAEAKARPAEQAEAGTLHAECALLERDANGAIGAYLEVAKRFASLPAGENAAFAAAQIAARQRDARASALFERYLARYPEGRFAAEARAALGR